MHVYERSGGTWPETQVLSRPGINFFGSSLALEGDTLLVGDSGNGDLAFNAGAAYFYTRQGGGAWTLETRVNPFDPSDDLMFGGSVALDGDLGVVGAPAAFDGQRASHADVFERVGSDWIFVQRLQGLGVNPASQVPVSVSISSGRVLLATPGDEATNTPGAVFVFELNGSTWVHSATLRSPEGGGDFDAFGTSITQAAGTVFVGSTTDGPGQSRGRLHVFDVDLNTPVPYCQATPNSTGQPATIRSIGSNLVQANDVTLAAGPVPDREGFFLIAAGQTQRPAFDGFLCIRGPLARLPFTQPVGGELIDQVDLTAQPFDVMPGSTWNFQAWFLDPDAGASGANLSDAIAITFCD